MAQRVEIEAGGTKGRDRSRVAQEASLNTARQIDFISRNMQIDDLIDRYVQIDLIDHDNTFRKQHLHGVQSIRDVQRIQ